MNVRLCLKTGGRGFRPAPSAFRLPPSPFFLALPLAAAEPDTAVDAGREALNSWWGSRYPWYDSASDGVQRVELRKPWNWDWVPDWNVSLGWLFPDTLIQWIAWILIALLLAGLLYLLIRSFPNRRASASDKQSVTEETDKDLDRVEALPFPIRSGRLDLLGEARRLYLEENYARAIIYLFSFQLVELDKNQVVRLTKGKTNRQYLRQIGPRRTLRELVEQTMVAFEDVFFGNHALERVRFESCWSRLDEFESLATEGVG